MSCTGWRKQWARTVDERTELLLILKVLPVAILIFSVDSQLLPVLLYCQVIPVDPSVIPAPFTPAVVDWPSARVMLRSAIETVVELIVVVAP